MNCLSVFGQRIRYWVLHTAEEPALEIVLLLVLAFSLAISMNIVTFDLDQQVSFFIFLFFHPFLALGPLATHENSPRFRIYLCSLTSGGSVGMGRTVEVGLYLCAKITLILV